jgi:hypothetical protein
MKKLLTSNITNTAKMPIRKMTLDHVQESYNEQIRALAIQIGTDDYPGTPGTTARDILFGLQSTTVGSAFTANRGAVYSQGEIFLVDAASFTIGAGQYPIFVLATTYATGDPTEFTDGNQYQIHQIRKLTLVSGTTLTAGYFDTFSLFTNKKLPMEVSSGAGITNGANITSGTVYAKKDHLGVVVMHGFVTMNSSFANGQTIMTLPSTHKPVFTGGGNPRIGVTIVNGGNFGTLFVEFQPSGAVVCVKDPSALIGNNANIYFDNVVFYTI